MRMIIGEKVRVYSSSGETSNRATVCLINDNGSIDVIYGKYAKVNSINEECNINPNRIRRLEPFEGMDSTDAEVLKEEGNVLYALKDYTAAIQHYSRGLNHLSSKKSIFGIGTNVLLSLPNSFEYTFGMISDEIDGKYDVMLDTEEEMGVDPSRLVELSGDFSLRILQKSLTLNIARCYFKRNQWGYAVKYSSIAIAILRSMEINEESSAAVSSKSFADALYFRGKVLLHANRPKFASKDCSILTSYDNGKANSLFKEIETHKLRQLKLNKKLAIDVSNWVQTALEMSENRDRNERRQEQMIQDVEDIDVSFEDERDDYEANEAQEKAVEKAETKFDCEKKEQNDRKDIFRGKHK